MDTKVFTELKGSEQRGSKPRCHLLTQGMLNEVAARLTSLAAPFAVVSSSDHWMPRGFEAVEECELHRASALIDPALSERLRAWWLAPASQHAKTPNFDIASSCTIGGKRGLLLVEAKAHDAELTGEAKGRILTGDSSEERKASHETIARAIREARDGLQAAMSLPVEISRDTCYQMSNRFAWAWKLASMGVPVVLVYLGFLRANEMADKGKPFVDSEDWVTLVKRHAAPIVPAVAWGRTWIVGGVPFTPLIQSVEVSLRRSP